MENFIKLGIRDEIIKAIMFAKYEEPTPIQEKAIPYILNKKDILASAQTGTGKTAAFAIPILQQIKEDKEISDDVKIRALVLTPTRELASQIAENFSIYGRYLKIRNAVIYGGVRQKNQEEALKKGIDILIATPGRLLDLMGQGIINLEDVKYLVLDEADQMLDMGFIKDVYKIINKTSKKRQTMLFSATMPKEIEKLAFDILKDHERISITPVTETLDLINQTIYYVYRKDKTELLVHLFKEEKMDSALVFTRTKNNANKLVKDLDKLGILAEAIHGNKSQNAREKALKNFKTGKTKILVATDIAARGIDINNLPFVINHNLPELPETYIHRIGRTGRKGLSGKSISFCDELEMKLLNQIEKHIKKKINVNTNNPYKMNPKNINVTNEKNKQSFKKTTPKSKKNKLK